jgi:hypothetical protein
LTERLVSFLPPREQYLTALVVLMLGLTLMIVVIGGVVLARDGKSIPDAIIAIGSVCAGALGGMLVPMNIARRRSDDEAETVVVVPKED